MWSPWRKCPRFETCFFPNQPIRPSGSFLLVFLTWMGLHSFSTHPVCHCRGLTARHHYFLCQGSTAFPKPITWNHRAFLVLARIPRKTRYPSCVSSINSFRLVFGEIDLCGLIIGCHAMPMFHGMGAFQLGSVVRLNLWRQASIFIYIYKKHAATFSGSLWCRYVCF